MVSGYLALAPPEKRRLWERGQKVITKEGMERCLQTYRFGSRSEKTKSVPRDTTQELTQHLLLSMVGTLTSSQTTSIR